MKAFYLAIVLCTDRLSPQFQIIIGMDRELMLEIMRPLMPRDNVLTMMRIAHISFYFLFLHGGCLKVVVTWYFEPYIIEFVQL